MICRKCNKESNVTFYEMCLECYDLTTPDPIVTDVINKFRQRSADGIIKYGTTLARTDLDLIDWLKHLQEELMDANLYIQRVLKEMEDQEDLHFKLSEQGYFDTTKEDDES